MNNIENGTGQNSNQFPAPQNGSSNGVAVYDPNLNASSIEDDEIDLRSLWRIVLRYKKLIGLILAVVVVTTLLITLLMRPMYTASVSLEVNTSGRSLVKFQNVENQDLGSREYISTQSKILGSAAVAREVITKIDLINNPEFNGELTQRGFLNGVKSIINIFRSTNVKSEQDRIKSAVNIYLDRLAIAPVRNTSIIEVKFESFSPDLAAKIANAHAQAYVKLSDDRRFSSTSGAKNFLEKEISVIQAKLETSEKKLNAFARKNGVIDIEDKNNIMIERLSDLSQSLSSVQNERIDAETRNIQAKTASAQRLSVVYDDLLIKSLREEQATYKAEYFELSKIYKKKYPAMQQLQAKIDEIEANINAQASKIIGGLKTNFEQLLLRENRLKSELESLQSQLLDLQDRAVTYNILKREWEANKELYSGLLERTKEIGVAAGMELNVGSVIDSASPPNGASSPRLLLNLMIASFLGLAGGLGAAFLLAMLDNTISDVEELYQYTGIGHLGVSPEIDLGDDVEFEVGSTERLKYIDTIAHHLPSDSFAESIQSVRTSLSYAKAGGFPKSIMVTSSVAGEGKSTIAINLAISCAKAGKRVIVLEADLRKSRHHKIFGVPTSPGLSDCLVGDKGEPAKQYHIEQMRNLSVVVAGSKAPNPVDLLGSAQMRQLITDYESEYDLVIVDCPPILGLADSIVMSKMVEAVLFVVAAHSTPRDAVKNSVQRLRMVGAPIIGTVFNKVQASVSGYDYYYSDYALEEQAT